MSDFPAIIRLERRVTDESADPGIFGFPRIDVVAFNIDGEGTALVRIWPEGEQPELQLVFGDDLLFLLEGDARGFREYREEGTLP